MTICTINANELADDTLTAEEWDELTEINFILRPFQQITKRIEGWKLLWYSMRLVEHMYTLTYILR
jgi:hypothetical protein